jgi:hypothetical protein
MAVVPFSSNEVSESLTESHATLAPITASNSHVPLLLATADDALRRTTSLGSTSTELAMAVTSAYR